MRSIGWGGWAQGWTGRRRRLRSGGRSGRRVSRRRARAGRDRRVVGWPQRAGVSPKVERHTAPVAEDALLVKHRPDGLPCRRPSVGVDVDEDLHGAGTKGAAVDLPQVVRVQGRVEQAFDAVAHVHIGAGAELAVAVDGPGDHQRRVGGLVAGLVVQAGLRPQRQLRVDWLRIGAGERHQQGLPWSGRPRVACRSRPGSAGDPGAGGAARRASRKGREYRTEHKRGRNGPALQAPGWHYAGKTRQAQTLEQAGVVRRSEDRQRDRRPGGLPVAW